MTNSRKLRAALVGAASLLFPALGHAADCAAPYTVDNLLADFLAGQAALKADQAEQAKAVAVRMEAGLGCLNAALPRQMAGSTFRVIGAGLYLGGDTTRGSAWLRTAAEAEPTYDYGVGEIPDDSPVRFAYMDAKGVSAEVQAVDGKKLLEGATFKLDGSSLSEPAAKVGRPHLLQRTDGAVTSWVIEGAAFPEEVLVTPVVEVAVVDPPKKTKEPKAPKAPKEPKVTEPDDTGDAVATADEPKPAKEPKAAKEPAPEKEPKAAKPAKSSNVTSSGEIKRKRPPEKTPLMIAGGIVVAAGGGLYYMAGQKRGDFDASNDIAEMDKLQKQVNAMVVASGAVAAVGAGTLTWGIILDGGTPMPTLQFRF